jgi:hypothetical protein
VARARNQDDGKLVGELGCVVRDQIG